MTSPAADGKTIPTTEYWDEEIETMPRGALETMQLSLLREHLEFAYRNSPCYRPEVEKRGGVALSDGAVAVRVRGECKNRLGLTPRNVTVHAEGTLPRSVHKAKRVIDRRGDTNR